MQASGQARTGERIPEVILQNIFYHLEVPDLKRAAGVCKKWRKHVDQPGFWRDHEVRVNFEGYSITSVLSLIKRRKLARVTIYGNYRPSAVRGFVESLPATVRVLRLMHENYISHKRPIFPRTMPSLRMLSIESAPIDGQVIRCIVTQVPQLTALSFRCSASFADADLELICSHMVHLKSLRLGYSHVISQASIAVLAGVDSAGNVVHSRPDLEELHIVECEMVTGKSLGFIAAAFPSLRNLSLAGCTLLRNDDLGALLPLRKLTEFNISSRFITDRGIRTLTQHAPHLEVLDLSRTRVTDRGLHSLTQGMSSLRLVNPSYCRGTEDGIVHLAETLPNLQALYLTENSLNGPSMRTIRQRVFNTNPRVEVRIRDRNDDILPFGC